MSKLTERLVLGGVALLIGLLLGWMVRGVATYNTATNTVTAYQDWRTACPAASQKQMPCEMVEDILDPKSKGTLARIGITKDNNKQIISFTLPFGVALEAGVGLRIGKDATPQVIQYRTCYQIGCIAQTDFTDKIANAMKNGTEVQMLFAGLDGKPVGAPISLKGYNDARRAYTSGESKRASWFWRLWS